MGRDKALLEIEGEACIARVAMALAEAGREPIRIAVAEPEDIERYGAAIDSTIQIEWVLDAEPHSGPIEALIEAFEDPLVDEETVQLAPVDVPWVNSALFVGLEGALGPSDCLVMPSDGLWAHPLLALVRPEMVVNRLKSGDRRPLHVQFAEMEHSLMLEEPSLMRNVNSPADLK
jgi:molybdopterin-guanine dinucleotide biosynthesis protein A